MASWHAAKAPAYNIGLASIRTPPIHKRTTPTELESTTAVLYNPAEVTSDGVLNLPYPWREPHSQSLDVNCAAFSTKLRQFDVV